MTAQVLPSSSSRPSSTSSYPTLLDRVLDSVTCCSSTANQTCGLSSQPIQPTTAIEPRGEVILPHLRFRPVANSDRSSLVEFYNLFLCDDAEHSFLLFHRQHGDTDVKVGQWRSASSSTSSSTLSRSIAFTTKVSNDAIPIGVTNTQTLSMSDDTLVLESRIAFDDSAFKGMSFLISSDVRGSEVCVRVVLREGSSGMMMMDPVSSPNPLLEEQASRSKNVFSCLTHPLLLPSDSICGTNPSTAKSYEGSSCYSDLNKPSHSNYTHRNNNYNNNMSVHDHAQVGASLLSAIQSKNKSPSWPHQQTIQKYSRFDDLATPMSSTLPTPTTTEDVLSSSSSRGELKLKTLPSFDLGKSTTAPNCNSIALTSGHLAMRRMILENDTTATTVRPGTNGIRASHNGLSMRIEMDISTPQTSNTTTSSTHSTASSSFPRSKGSYMTSQLDTKILKGLRKRVSRTWISWAESWCMRLWEENYDAGAFLNTNTATNRVTVNDRKRKTNVRPTVRRIGERRETTTAIDTDGTMNSTKSRLSTSAVLPESLKWNTMDIDTQTKWTFVRQSSDTVDECGVEVSCVLNNAPKVARTDKKEEVRKKKNNLSAVEKAKDGKVTKRWRSPQMRKRIGR